MLDAVETLTALASALVAASAFAWGVWQYFRGERERRAQLQAERQREAEHRRIEATRPFLEKQLEFYLEATRVAATIAVSGDARAASEAKERFFQLFWGQLALVEDEPVERQMVAFKQAIDNGGDLEGESLRLAHACRRSLARSWGTPAWESHYA